MLCKTLGHKQDARVGENPGNEVGIMVHVMSFCTIFSENGTKRPLVTEYLYPPKIGVFV